MYSALKPSTINLHTLGDLGVDQAVKLLLTPAKGTMYQYQILISTICNKAAGKRAKVKRTHQFWQFSMKSEMWSS